ncbi:MAG: transcriptional regulator, MarR family [Bacteroidetes bacterium]|nr:transcriptional regulator, MarR family [Bacteroidota bacterium]
MDDLDQEIKSISDNLSHVVPILGRIFIKGVRSKTNMTQQTLQTLGALWHHGKLTMTGIGHHLSVPKPHVTALVDRLIAEEMVERLNDENDRRIIYIQLTEKGRERFWEIKQIMTESLRASLLLVDKEKLHKLNESAQYINEILTEVGKTMIQNCSSSSECKKEIDV